MRRTQVEIMHGRMMGALRNLKAWPRNLMMQRAAHRAVDAWLAACEEAVTVAMARRRADGAL